MSKIYFMDERTLEALIHIYELLDDKPQENVPAVIDKLRELRIGARKLTANTPPEIAQLASDLYDKWVLQYEGRNIMSKDLFTLAVQDILPKQPSEEWKSAFYEHFFFKQCFSSHDGFKEVREWIDKNYTLTRKPNNDDTSGN